MKQRDTFQTQEQDTSTETEMEISGSPEGVQSEICSQRPGEQSTKGSFQQIENIKVPNRTHREEEYNY